jgi:deferrochelatase/peroxidase EfeB
MMLDLESLVLPRPYCNGRVHQPGITDPVWPIDTPVGINDRDYQYFAGRVAPQGFLTLVFADTTVTDRNSLKKVLKALHEFSKFEMDRKPDRVGVPPQVAERLPNDYRVTITIGFGASLFVNIDGDDRFEIGHMKPRFLKMMPSFPGVDAEVFRPEEHATDLVVQICSDHPYVNAHIAKGLHEYKFGKGLKIRRIEHGFARQDTRESLQFDDGISNLRSWPENTMERLAYVGPADNDLEWCIGGSYLVYRKMAENLPLWERFSDEQQSQMIGRNKASGKPLSRATTCPFYDANCQDFDKMPVYPDPTSDMDGRIDGHMRKSQPRRPGPDFLGVNDLNRMFLRRPYPYFDGMDLKGNPAVGLHFIAFMKNVLEQFEHVTQMWQANRNFPTPGAGIDVLMASGVIEAISGGYYFCPPWPKQEEEFLGAAILS